MAKFNSPITTSASGIGFILLDNVKEVFEGDEVRIQFAAPITPGIQDDFEFVPAGAAGARPVLVALNDGGFNSTAVDLLGLIAWIKQHEPQLLSDHEVISQFKGDFSVCRECGGEFESDEGSEPCRACGK